MGGRNWRDGPTPRRGAPAASRLWTARSGGTAASSTTPCSSSTTGTTTAWGSTSQERDCPDVRQGLLGLHPRGQRRHQRLQRRDLRRAYWGDHDGLVHELHDVQHSGCFHYVHFPRRWWLHRGQ